METEMNPSEDFGSQNSDVKEIAATMQQKIIKKFVITGGPCSGKTTALARLQSFLRERGFRVFVAPEAATMLFLNGATFDDMNSPALQVAFQHFVIRTQMALEDSLLNYAKNTDSNCVILCDRGLMDGSAYVTKEMFNDVLGGVNLDLITARDARYDGVFHLVTCADGAPDFYTLSNNEARSEDLQAAIDVDRKLENAWAGHPHHVIIDNKDHKAFDQKIQELVASISKYVGLPSLTKQTYKYVLASRPDISTLPNVQIFDCEKVMLDTNKFVFNMDTSNSTDHVKYCFIRKRTQGRFHSYGMTTVKELESGEQIELKQVITARMYGMLKNYSDATRVPIKQKRYYFLWEQQSFHIYEYLEPKSDLLTLQCQSNGPPKLPRFLNIAKSVSRDDKSASSYFLSLKENSPRPSAAPSMDAEESSQ